MTRAKNSRKFLSISTIVILLSSSSNTTSWNLADINIINEAEASSYEIIRPSPSPLLEKLLAWANRQAAKHTDYPVPENATLPNIEITSELPRSSVGSWAYDIDTILLNEFYWNPTSTRSLMGLIHEVIHWRQWESGWYLGRRLCEVEKGAYIGARKAIEALDLPPSITPVNWVIIKVSAYRASNCRTGRSTHRYYPPMPPLY